MYYYKFKGKIDYLQVKEGKSQGFVFMKWEDLEKETEIVKKIIPVVYKEIVKMYKENIFNL